MPTCKDCGVLTLLRPSPLRPHSLEPIATPSPDSMIQPPDFSSQIFVCRTCGSHWHYEGRNSAWSSVEG